MIASFREVLAALSQNADGPMVRVVGENSSASTNTHPGRHLGLTYFMSLNRGASGVK